MNDSVIQELERIVGSARVTDNEGALWAYAFNDFGSLFNPPFVLVISKRRGSNYGEEIRCNRGWCRSSWFAGG